MEPTARIMPPGLRGGGAARLRAPEVEPARALAGPGRSALGWPSRPARAKSPIRGRRPRRARAARDRSEAGHGRRRLGGVTRPEGRGIQLAALATELDYPDPASFLTRCSATTSPPGCRGPTPGSRPARPPARAGARPRSRSPRLASGHTRSTGRPVRDPRPSEQCSAILGCRLSNGVDPGLDLAALCLERR